jgi:hypothetical protein
VKLTAAFSRIAAAPLSVEARSLEALAAAPPLEGLFKKAEQSLLALHPHAAGDSDLQGRIDYALDDIPHVMNGWIYLQEMAKRTIGSQQPTLSNGFNRYALQVDPSKLRGLPTFSMVRIAKNIVSCLDQGDPAEVPQDVMQVFSSLLEAFHTIDQAVRNYRA